MACVVAVCADERVLFFAVAVAGDVNNVVRGQQYLKLDLVRATDGIAAATSGLLF